MNLLPTTLPDEYIGSVIRRKNELFNLGKLSRKEYKITPPFNYRETLTYFTCESNPTLETLMEATLFPLAKSLGLSTSPLTVITPRDSWRICRQCITTDLKNIGVGYIRRHHLLASIKVCDLHGLSLDEICPTCNTSIKMHLNSSFHECAKSFNFNKNDQGKENKIHTANIKYAKFVLELLHCNTHNPDFSNVRTAIYNQLRKLGYELNGSIHWKHICVDVNSLLGEFIHKNKIDFSIGQLNPITSLGSITKIAFFAFRTTDAYWRSVRETSYMGKALNDCPLPA
ncbi:hypothetical protein AN403_5251 [Pseudomonas fluorescens]|uniref:Uncharacterized protein n=1 Tax=Pseudomonas fluorescens TaxID=294 RepID=A0A0P8ZUJ9_PSEFL|nr:hypothetical protein AN403_5251 [Pseudomonas fluorescens]